MANRKAVFQVLLAKAVSWQVKVDYATVDGTAVAGEDYTHTSGTLTFEPGETSKEVEVPLRSTEEATPESFTLQLSQPVRGRLVRASGSATIPVVGLGDYFPNRELTVLFYQGQKHETGGAPSDEEWTLAMTPATLDNEDGSPGETPFSNYYGQIHYDAGPGTVIRGGGGPIQLASGWYLHVLVAPSDPETTTVQCLFGNRATIAPDLSLDPATLAEFDAWWDQNAAGRRLGLYSPDGALVVSVMLAVAAEQGSPNFLMAAWPGVAMAESSLGEAWVLRLEQVA